MRQNTASVSRGRVAPTHNTREYVTDKAHCPDHIHYDRIGDNLVLVNEPIRVAYDRIFGEALSEYNARQTRADRRIDSYLDHVRADKKLHDAYEFVVQVGNVDDHLADVEAKTVYAEWLDRFVERYGCHFDVIQAVVHVDEATPHMHVEFVPVATASRGLAVQNSFSRAMRQSGEKDFVGFQAHMAQMLGDVMARHGIERVAGDKDRQMDGVDINVYKRTLAWEKEQKAQVDDELAKARDEAAKARSAAKEARRTAERTLADANERLESVKEREDALDLRASSLAVREAKIKELEASVSVLQEKRDELQGEVGRLAKERRDLALQVEWWQRKAQDVVAAFDGLVSLVEAIVRLPFDARGFLDGLRAAVRRPEFKKALRDVGHLRLPRRTAQRAAESLREDVYEQGCDLLGKVREINEASRAMGRGGHGRGGHGDDPLGL